MLCYDANLLAIHSKKYSNNYVLICYIGTAYYTYNTDYRVTNRLHKQKEHLNIHTKLYV